MSEEPFNAANSKQVKERKRSDKDEERQREADVRAILAIPAGSRYIWHLLEQCRVFQSAPTLDHATVCFSEGQRAIGLKILQDVEAASPNALLTMLTARKEHGNQE